MPDPDPTRTPHLAPDDAATSPPEPDTSGGVNLHGDNLNIAGDVVGGAKIVHGDSVAGDKVLGDKYVITEETAYDVRGLANPYLGLASFTYADRTKYAGREKLVTETVARMTAPGAPLALLFVTGASGSGKSSFAQAGLIPALETYYTAFAVKHAVMRPASDPLAALADAAWRQLDLGTLDPTNLSPEIFGEFLASKTSAQQHINVLVVDQFEELFTQSAPNLRDAFMALLANLPPFAKTRTHLIATLRADYLPDLFNRPALYEIAKGGVDLRAMSVDELSDAIQQPLRVSPYGKEKRFEPALVAQLATDAAQDAAYLPLLQVTLEELWRKGSLTRGAYTNLTDALEERADKVLQFRDYDAATPAQPRSPAEQAALLDLLLNLVDVAPDDDARRDVRRQRSKAELAQGSLDRVQWIDQLAQARLLSVETEADGKRVEVDLIHESLLTNWDRLHAAIGERRQQLRQRARFEQNLGEWTTHMRSDDYLLEGVRLAEARELEQRGDIALQSADAKAFVRTSVAKVEAERQQELERERQRAAALEQARVEAEKRAASEKQRARIFRIAALGLSGLLVIAIIASFLAWRQTQSSDARRIASQATALRTSQFDQALLLATYANGLDNNPDVQNTLVELLTSPTHFAASLKGHTNWVYALMFSPDGKLLVSGGGDKTILLWDVARHQLIGAPLRGHQGTVYSVVFSPDGKWFASGGDDKKIIVWDVATRQPLKTLTGVTGSVHGVAFSPNGKMLAAGLGDNNVMLWDTATWQPLATLKGHADAVWTVAFSPDSKWLASGSGDRSIVLWDIAARQPVGTFQGHSDAIASVAFSPDGKFLASGSLDNTGRLWDVTTREAIGPPLTGQAGGVYSIAFSPDGKLLAMGNGDNTVILRDVATRQPIGPSFTGHQSEVFAVAFSPDGKTLGSASADNTIILQQVATREPLGVPLSGHRGAVYSVAFGPDNTTLASGSLDKSIMLWDATSAKPIRELDGHTSSVSSVAFDPAGKLLASGSLDKTIRFWDVATGQPILAPLVGHTGGVYAIAFDPKGDLLASASADGSIMLWDVASGQPNGQPLFGHEGTVFSVAFSPDGKSLASGGLDKTIRLWNIATRQPIGRPWMGHTSWVSSVAFRPDGTILASGSGDGSIILWDIATQQQMGSPLIGQHGAVYAVGFSRDGKLLASANEDGNILVWDMGTRKPLGLPITEHKGSVFSIAFSPDGKWMASGNLGKTISVWDASPDGWQSPACYIARRNLTREEWAQYINSIPFTYKLLYALNPTCPNLPVTE